MQDTSNKINESRTFRTHPKNHRGRKSQTSHQKRSTNKRPSICLLTATETCRPAALCPTERTEWLQITAPQWGASTPARHPQGLLRLRFLHHPQNLSLLLQLQTEASLSPPVLVYLRGFLPCTTVAARHLTLRQFLSAAFKVLTSTI